MGVTRYPNRVGQTGTYAVGPPDTVSLDAAALDGYRTFAEAAAANRLIEGDIVGILLRESAHPERWLIARATYAAGTLTMVETEDVASTPPADSAAVEVQCVITDGMLQALDASYSPIVVGPVAFDGPDYFDIASAGTTWDAESGWYAHSTWNGDSTFIIAPTLTGSQAGWGAGYRPVNVSLDLYIPVDPSYDVEYVALRVYYNGDEDYIDGDYVGSGYTGGEWVTVNCPNLEWDLTTDVSSIRLVYLPGAGSEEASLYRVRNIVFTDP